jgi:hypothetical protein
MAAREHRVSRRVLLGAACAFPLLRHPELDSGSTFFPSPTATRWIPDQVRNDERGDDLSRAVTKWDLALARFRRAQSALDAAAHEPDEDRYGDILGAFNNALRRLLRTPAPDLPALSLKIDLAVDHEIAELTGGEACLARLKRDAHRLAFRAS